MIPRAIYIYLNGPGCATVEHTAAWRANMINFSLVSVLWRVSCGARGHVVWHAAVPNRRR